jgi:hypothetical protein
MGMALLNALREDLISEAKLGYEGFAADCIEVVRIKRSMTPLLLLNVKEIKAGYDNFKVTMTKILPDPFMLEPHAKERRR